MSANGKSRWGVPPWQIDFEPKRGPLPRDVDVAVIGGGFTGLAAAGWLRRLAPERTVALLEAGQVGSGASGRTGGLALGETAAGDLPGLGDVLKGFANILEELEVPSDLQLTGAWELGRSGGSSISPIEWSDSGSLRVAGNVPGGTVDAGKMVAGLARAAERLGAHLHEFSPVSSIVFENPLRLLLPNGELLARQAVLATNAQALDLSGLADRAQPKFTLAVATAPMKETELESIGLGERKPFYTIDLPYLWGRVLRSNGIIFGGGLVHLKHWQEFAALDIASGEPVALLAGLEKRIRALHPALREVEFTHRWGGPILIGEGWQPVFSRHRRNPNALVLGAYSGHGVALSVYLARWAAEVLLGRRSLPSWGAIPR
jgi:glycine/D-amino acid oxidase-like deaminating enzyme